MSIDKRKIGKLAIILVFMLVAVVGCSTRSQQDLEARDIGDQARVADAEFTGVIIGNDVEQKQLVLQELGSDREVTLFYDAASHITDKYDQQKEGEKLECGEIMEMSYQLSSARIVTMNVPEDVWEYQEVKRFSVDSAEKSFSTAGEKFQYSDLTYIGTDGQRMELMELNQQDVLTVRGTGYSVYSIVRTEGHGYIRLANYQDFIGGMVGVGNGIILPIAKNMLITAREGIYRVLLNKGAMTAVKTVTVSSDQEITVDFSDYQLEAENVGNITFEVEPAGADMTINGTAVDYSSPIALSYGTYHVTVAMNGYQEYSGILDVEKPSDKIRISLVDQKAEVASESTSSPTTSSAADTDDNDIVTKRIDSDHKITVSAPEGAEIYLDNVYKGLSPCSFTKVIGTQTLTLRKNGYITKSYSVDILDDSEDVTLSFDELEMETSKESTSTPEATAESTE